MDICFKTRKLRKIFNSQHELKRAYGALARKLMMRMTLLRAVKNLSQVPTIPPMRCHQLTGNRDEEFAVDLKHPHRLIFRPQHSPIPRKEDGGIDVGKVTAIEIIEVNDYH